MTTSRTHEENAPQQAGRRPSRWLWAAAVAGGLHALASLYWMLGGDWLIETLGATVIEMFEGRRWLLLPVVVVKVAGAVVPLLMHDWPGPLRRVTRFACWVGAAALLGWGGAGMVIANLVLTGVIESGPIDRPAMIGHAWLWDPLFVAWGACMAVGLWRTRDGGHARGRARSRGSAEAGQLPSA